MHVLSHAKNLESALIPPSSAAITSIFAALTLKP